MFKFDCNIRTIFAHIPTGYLHLDNICTDFFCWLFAKKNNWKFFLRIDDTDEIRSSKKYVNNIFDVLKWLNLNYDNVFFQSKRYDIYRYYLNELLSSGKAYKCYCTKNRLFLFKNSQIRDKKKMI